MLFRSPVISHLNIYSGEPELDGVWRLYYGCANAPNYFGWTVNASDPDTTDLVTMYYRWTDGSILHHEMTREDSYGELWDDSLTVQENWAIGPLSVWFQGTDALGNLGPKFDPATEGYRFEVGECQL